MKKTLFCVLLAGILTFFCGCGEETAPTTSVASSDDDKSAYISLVELLRDELDETEEKLEKAEENLKKLKENFDKELAAVKNSVKEIKEGKDDEKNVFTYQKAGGEVTITGYNGAHSVLAIPSELDDLPVTEIADSVFAGNTTLVSVTIPSGVKKLGWFVFSGCTSLSSVTLTSSVESIGYDAFANCKKLTIHAPSGSYAERYAASYGISCVAG